MTVARRTVLRAAAAVAAPWLVRARAQTRARRIGVLIPGVDSGGDAAFVAEHYKRLGWIVGETLLVERRYAAWRAERMPEFVDELLRRQGVELLVAFGSVAAAAAARATRTIPIVFCWAFLPIECGLIASYAKPGRNCTGIALNTGIEVVSKQYEFIRAIAPSAQRVAYISADLSQFTLSGAPLNPWPEFAVAAKTLGFEQTVHIARRIEDVEAALIEAAAARAQAALISGHSTVGAASRVADFALRQRWVTGTLTPELFYAGLLFYHGLSEAEANYMFARMFQMVDRVLRGTNPAEIPVELPTRFALAVNLKAARALGLTLPPSLLLRADRVVE